MAQKLLQLVCMIPGGQYISPFLTALVNPACCSVLILSVFLPILYSEPSRLNTKDGERSSSRAFLSAFMIWYPIVVTINCIIFYVLCKAM
jgi:hypothetical protein